MGPLARARAAIGGGGEERRRRSSRPKVGHQQGASFRKEKERARPKGREECTRMTGQRGEEKESEKDRLVSGWARSETLASGSRDRRGFGRPPP